MGNTESTRTQISNIQSTRQQVSPSNFSSQSL